MKNRRNRHPNCAAPLGHAVQSLHARQRLQRCPSPPGHPGQPPSCQDGSRIRRSGTHRHDTRSCTRPGRPERGLRSLRSTRNASHGCLHPLDRFGHRLQCQLDSCGNVTRTHQKRRLPRNRPPSSPHPSLTGTLNSADRTLHARRRLQRRPESPPSRPVQPRSCRERPLGRHLHSPNRPCVLLRRRSARPNQVIHNVAG